MINFIGKIQIAIANTQERMSVTPILAEPVWDTDLKQLFIGDGNTVGGIEISAGADLSTIINRLNQLQDDLDDETLARTSQDTILGNRIDVVEGSLQTEVEDRIEAYNTLQNTKLNISDFNTFESQLILWQNTLSNVAFSGDYDDLINKPSIPSVPVLSVNTKTGHVVLNKADVGLGNVDNTSDLDKPVSTLTQVALNHKADIAYVDPIFNDLEDAIDTKANTADLSTVAFSGNYNDLTNKPNIPSVPVLSVNTKTGHVVLNKSDVGLSNVDNTSDLNKPISTATQNALDLKLNITDWDTWYQGTYQSDQLALWDELGNKLNTSDWDQFQYNFMMWMDTIQPIAYSGDYNDLINTPQLVNSVNTMSGDVTITKATVGLGNVDNTSDLNKPISTLTQDALDLKANIVDMAGVAFSGSYNDLLNKPTIPAAQVPSDWNATSGVARILNKPTTLSGYGITDAIPVSQKGANNGVVPLDNTGKIPNEYIPPLAISETFIVADEPAMLALTVQQGDIAVRTDLSKTYINRTGTNTSMADWTEMLSPPNDVVSVNGKVGVVVLNKTDIGLGNVDNTSDMNKPVSTAMSNALSLKADTGDLADVAFSGDYDDLINKPSIPSVPVLSVNTKTGHVVLNKSDVGLGNVDNTSDAAKPISTATQNALNAKANTADLADVALSGDYDDLINKPTIPTIPVTSVNTKTGAVVLNKSDIGLGNVDNTSDLNKPISTATQNALNLKLNVSTFNSWETNTFDVNINRIDSDVLDLQNEITTLQSTKLDIGTFNTFVGTLADVAFSGSYNDLLNKPTIPAAQVPSDWNATTGVSRILNKPVLGTAATYDATAFATATQGAKADAALSIANNALPKAGGTMDVEAVVNELRYKPVVYEYTTDEELGPEAYGSIIKGFGPGARTFTLPPADVLKVGMIIRFINMGTSLVTAKPATGNLLYSVGSSVQSYGMGIYRNKSFICVNDTTWNVLE